MIMPEIKIKDQKSNIKNKNQKLENELLVDDEKTSSTNRGLMAERYQETGVCVIEDSPKLDIDPAFIWRMIKLFRQEKIDVVHTHQLKTTVNGILAAALAGVPRRIAHIHDTILQWEIPWYKKLINVAVNTTVCNLFATDVIALTVQVKEWLVNGERIKSEKLRIIPNGIDVARFARPGLANGFFLRKKLGLTNETVLVGSLGRLTIEKGHIYLIEAVPIIKLRIKDQRAKLQFKDQNLHFVLVGEGNQRGLLESRMKELNIEDQVTLLGFQPEEDKPKILWDLDIFVFPSIREGFGIAMLEAMAAGLPVVASDLPKALREIASDSEVIFFEPRNPKSLADKVVELINNPDLRKKLASNAQIKTQAYSLPKLWDNYEKLYQ